MRRSRAVLLSLAFLALTCPARADNWPQWRGAHFDGVSKETGLPAEWGDGKNIAWKLPLPGTGGATPADARHTILAARVVVTIGP